MNGVTNKARVCDFENRAIVTHNVLYVRVEPLKSG